MTNRPRPKILFYVERSLHLPFLEPIQAYLAANHLADTAYSAPPFFAGVPGIPQWGLQGEKIARLTQSAPFYSAPEDFQPDVTIVADACHFRIPHIKNVINVGHGMICKGAFYTDSETTRRENLSRMLLVPGPWHRSRLASNVLIPIEVTGFIKSDLLFGPKVQGREEFCARHGIDPSKRIVLFAPTYNPELSAMHCVAEGIRKVADKDTILLIKLHNMSEQRWKDLYRNIAAACPNVFYLEDVDYSGMMHAADLMISDVSSIFIEFLLLDKPVVLFNNPKIKEFSLYSPDDIEYRTRDAAVLVNSLEELLDAVRSELAHPRGRSAIRQRYALALDHGRDGRCAERAAKAILKWVHGREEERPSVTVAILEPAKASREDIMKDLAALGETSWDFRVGVFGGREAVANVERHAIGAFDQDAVRDFLSTTQTKRAVVLCGGISMPRDWPKWLENHFSWNPGTDAVKALTDPMLAEQCMRQLSRSNRPFTEQSALSFGLLMAGIGQSFDGRRIPSECIMLDQAVATSVPERLQASTPSEYITALGLLDKLRVRLAIDCYMHPADLKKRLLRDMRSMIKQGLVDQAAVLARKLDALQQSPDPAST